MVRIIGTVCTALIALFCSYQVLADEPADEPVKPFELPAIDPQAPAETTTVTIYESKIFPGFRPCTEQDYRNYDYDPIACQDDEAAKVLSIRSRDQQPHHLIVGDEAMPQGNIYKLRFQVFTRKRQED